jgi:hypothetical protein
VKQALVVVLVLLALAGAVGACGSDSKPQPAASVTYIPGETFPRTTTSVKAGRIVMAYVNDDATIQQRRDFGQRIASLPQVEKFAFAEKMDLFAPYAMRMRFNSQPRNPDPLGALASAYWIVLREADQIRDVTEELRDEPALRRGDSPFSGVRPARDFYAEMERMLIQQSQER